MRTVLAMRNALASKKGQSLVEYALIIALVAVVLIVGLTALSGGISNVFNAIVAAL
jgi:pilus assembly protein Flp/PilA